MTKRRDEKTKFAEYFINFTEDCIHMYNEWSGIKGDFAPAQVDEESGLVTIEDVNSPINGEDIPIDELIEALDGTDVYCIVEDEDAAERLFGDELGQVATVFHKLPGRGEDVTYLNWAANDDYSVRFGSKTICI